MALLLLVACVTAPAMAQVRSSARKRAQARARGVLPRLHDACVLLFRLSYRGPAPSTN
jgi:hypothetical protein